MAVRQETAPTLAASALLREPYNQKEAVLATEEDFDDPESDLDHDEFEDAEEEQLPPLKMDLQTSFEDCEVAIKKFFNNDVVGALNIMQPWGQTSLYHSLGTSIFEFIPAMLTFDRTQIARTIAALKVTISICNQHRKNYSLVESIGTMIKKPNYATYTDLEAHAELCYAEALLLQAAMFIMEGEDLTGLIKGTFKVKNCYNTYKECAKILEKKEWQTEQSKTHFQSGVRLGIATFNVMISLLPPKIISLLEFVGFSGNKAQGLADLEAGSTSGGLRSVLCELTLLLYHLVICTFTGGEGDLLIAEQILQRELKVYPNGVWFLLFKGRLEFLRGMFENAFVTYIDAINSQDIWKQFRHVCYWEIIWVNGLTLEWRVAAAYAGKLVEESNWSRTIYTYAKASMFLQLGDNMSIAERQQCNELMNNASLYKQRIAGKSLPMEKFVIKRCARYQAQRQHLVLPAVELFCLWNMFSIVANNHQAAQAILKLIENTREEFEPSHLPWENGYEADNRALLCYLHGCILSAMKLPWLALDMLHSVLEYKNDIKEDTFLIPYAIAEMAMCYYKLGNNAKAIQLLQEARKKYSGYSLESRLHFRMHAKMQMVKGNVSPNGSPEAATGSKTVTSL